MGAESIVTEYEHGTAEHKEQQEILFAALQEGDTLCVTEVSRLTRSMKQLCQIIEMLKEKKVRLMILNGITIDCRSGNIDPATKAFLQMTGVFAELEREMITTRVRSGMANAAAKGTKLGRPSTTAADIPESFKKHLPLFRSGRINKVEFSRLSGLSRPSIDKYLKLVSE